MGEEDNVVINWQSWRRLLYSSFAGQRILTGKQTPF
jgi:hypothetical protein